MSCLGNLIWFVCAGLWQGLGWTLMGCLWCLTIVGIPVGRQCFKFASLSFCPFGREVRFGSNLLTTPLNLIWLIVSGWELALASCVNGLVLCVTIVGIPWGMQCFKLARLALMPFGSDIIRK